MVRNFLQFICTYLLAAFDILNRFILRVGHPLPITFIAIINMCPALHSLLSIQSKIGNDMSGTSYDGHRTLIRTIGFSIVSIGN